MNLKAKSKFWIAWLGLIAIMVLSLSNSVEMVLCFEPDGRLTVETGVAGICSDSFEEASHATLTQKAHSVQELSCKGCKDVPITIKSTEAHQKFSPIQQEPISILFSESSSPTVNQYLATATQGVLPNPPPFRPPALTHLSTVVLLI